MAAVRQRRGGRTARRRERMSAPVVQVRHVTRDIPVYDLLDEDGIERLHLTSMQILEEIGIDFRDKTALAQWRDAGADVDGERVRIPRGMIEEKLALAPERYVQVARNPERSITVGGADTVFAPSFGSPFVRDLDGKRRYATLEDLQNFVKLVYMAPELQHSGGVICEPIDVPVPKRHLDIVYSHMKFSDKPFMGVQSAPERALDSCRMCEILFGADFLRENTVMTSVVNCNSPLVWDASMLGALRHYASHNQAVLVSPFIMAGAMAPITTAGAIAQLNAEVTAGIAYAQMVKPGVPMVYGSFLATVSMRSGAPMMGTPETLQMIYAVGQLARRYRLPMRAGGMLTGAKIADAQAAYESMQTMSAHAACGNPFRASRRRLARGGAERRLWQVHHGRRADRHAADAVPAARPFRERARDGRTARGRPGQPLSGLCPYPAKLPHGMLHSRGCRQQQFRAVAGRRRPDP